MCFLESNQICPYTETFVPLTIASLITLCFKPRARHRVGLYAASIHRSYELTSGRAVAAFLRIILVVNRVQIWTIRSHTSGEMKLGIFYFRIHEGNCWAAKWTSDLMNMLILPKNYKVQNLKLKRSNMEIRRSKKMNAIFKLQWGPHIVPVIGAVNILVSMHSATFVCLSVCLSHSHSLVLSPSQSGKYIEYHALRFPANNSVRSANYVSVVRLRTEIHSGLMPHYIDCYYSHMSRWTYRSIRRTA